MSRELDAEVAVKVMGARIHHVPSLDGSAAYEHISGKHDRPLPRYSTNMSAAWELVELFEVYEMSCYQGRHLCTLSHQDPIKFGFANEETAALAICRAALNAFKHSSTNVT